MTPPGEVWRGVAAGAGRADGAVGAAARVPHRPAQRRHRAAAAALGTAFAAGAVAYEAGSGSYRFTVTEGGSSQPMRSHTGVRWPRGPGILEAGSSFVED